MTGKMAHGTCLSLLSQQDTLNFLSCLLNSSTLQNRMYNHNRFHTVHVNRSTMLSDSFILRSNPLTPLGFCVWHCVCQNTEKQMRQLAVIPPMLFDAEQQRIKFINMNGLMDDPMKVYKDRQVMNMWSEQEKDTFREK